MLLFARELSKTYPDIEFFICALKRGGVFEEKLKSFNIRYTIIGGRSIIKHIISTVRIVKSERANVIHAHMLYSDIVALCRKNRQSEGGIDTSRFRQMEKALACLYR